MQPQPKLTELSPEHFHSGISIVNGSMVLGFYTANVDFGSVKTIAVDNIFYTSLLNDPLYVEAHSTLYPGGIIKGQIR